MMNEPLRTLKSQALPAINIPSKHAGFLSLCPSDALNSLAELDVHLDWL